MDYSGSGTMCRERLWGTLYINEVNESTLETFGSLIDPQGEGSHTIVGRIKAGQEFVTLIDCFPTNTRSGFRDCQTISGGWYCLPSSIDLQSPQPHFKDGAIYRPGWPTFLGES